MAERDSLKVAIYTHKMAMLPLRKLSSMRQPSLNKKNEAEDNNNLNANVNEEASSPKRTMLKKLSTRRQSILGLIPIPKPDYMTSNSNTNTNTNASMLSTLKRPKWKRQLEKFLNSSPVLIFMSILTICALFLSDIQAAWLRIEVDYGFNVFQTIIFAFFIIEFVLNCLCIKDYLLSFFFWLDLIATVSLIQDLDYIMFPILGYGPTTNSSKSSIQAAKAVAKVASATRATRVLRVVRIVRLIRMVKLYKSLYQARENREKMLEEKKKKELEQKEREYFENHSNSNSNNVSQSSRNVNVLNVLSNGNGNGNNQTQETNSRINPYSLNSNRRNTEEENQGINSNNNNNNNNNEGENSNRNGNNLETNGNLMSNGITQSNIQSNNILTEGIEKKPPLRSLIRKASHRSLTSNSRLDEEENESDVIKESKISRIITESNTKKIIVLILVLLIIFPLLSEDFYTDDSSMTYYLICELIANYRPVVGSSDPLKDISFSYSDLFDETFPPLNISINGSLSYFNNNYTIDYFRYKETRHAYSSNGFVHINYSILTETSMTGWLNIIQTCFICFCLTFASMSLESQANLLVLSPLEIMIEIVAMVAKDPMNAKNVENLQTGIKEAVNSDKKTSDNYEVQIIKTAIIKISALLAIGFGEAGGEIIKKNLSSANELNTRLKGKKKDAIFGFCDIRNFEDITLALEERTMIFVNQIAEIVHSSVDRFGGATNKNIGEAFLNVWKFYNETPIKANSPNKAKKVQRKDNLLKIDPTNPQVSIIADMSVGAFLRVLLKVNKSLNILAYKTNEAILKHLPNFRLSMGFGLHMGYGIEGAVGSTYKFDASYLSPNVNIAARLESATRQFGTPLLISGVLYKLLSPEMKQLCRFVDCVQVKGSTQPLDLYTIDVNLNVTPENEEKIMIMANREKRNFYSDKKDNFKREVEITKSVVRVLLDKASYYELLKTDKTQEFYDNWNKGIGEYKRGNFKQANDYFATCLKIDSTDGPAKTLMNYFKNCGYKAPANWEGTRELLAK